MSDSLPLAYVRIWAMKNQCTIHIERKSSDKLQINRDGIYLVMPDGGLASVNVRQVFPVVDRYPSLEASDLIPKVTTPTRQFFLQAVKRDDSTGQKSITFAQIRDEVESYFSLLPHLDPIQLYLAIRTYERGVLGLPHLTRIAGLLKPGVSLGAMLLEENLCKWEDLLAVCLDLNRPAAEARSEVKHAIPVSEFELIGEILVALGRVSRTQLIQAVASKSKSDKPIGEILVEMGYCSSGDIESAVLTQTDLRNTEYGSIGLLGELLIEGGAVRRDDVFDALRLQKVARQRLDGILVSMGVCTAEQIQDFRVRCPGGLLNNGEINEEKLGEWVVLSNLCNPRELEGALRLQRRGRQMLGELLVNSKCCSEQDLMKALSTQRERGQSKPNKPKRLGELLVSKRVVTESQLEEAAQMQQQGRKKIGRALIDLGACTDDDFQKALKLQFSWRESSKNRDDKLGQELLKDGLVSEQGLSKALEIHGRVGKPLGQILVEQASCTPEMVIDTLIRRDERRRAAFSLLIQQHSNLFQRPESLRMKSPADSVKQEALAQEKGLVQKVSSWLFKRTHS